MKIIKIWTDGGSRVHAQKGQHVKSTDSAAWAFLIKYPNNVTIHRTGFRRGETNNQMELQGAISALATLTNNGFCRLKAPRVVLITDSQYIHNAFAKNWIKSWQKKQFKGVKNSNRWKTLLYLINHIADLRIKWVKGHNVDRGNIFVDHALNKRMDHEEQLQKQSKQNKDNQAVKE